jgi:hypothetical protein
MRALELAKDRARPLEKSAIIQSNAGCRPSTREGRDLTHAQAADPTRCHWEKVPSSSPIEILPNASTEHAPSDPDTHTNPPATESMRSKWLPGSGSIATDLACS